MGVYHKKLEPFEFESDFPGLSKAQEVFLANWFSHCERQDRYLPQRSDFHPAEFGVHMKNVVVFDISKNPTDFQYRLFGTAVRANSDQDYTGQALSTIKGKGPESELWNALIEVRDSQKPVYKAMPYVGPSQDYKHLTVLFLPLSSDNKSCDKILLVKNYIFQNAETRSLA
ncbi:PAS domain-containing protein [Kordiimonas sp. SCSIO 12610]|uniref:PAS domain-containing protein n=1 Tax=Kordiimonas sp. SCSIO 12610 TaxID=2829597 RepID=UPI00210D3869|nr:PAS domain-containing protein [Kordiimonas sp. SCSIO 12610]UTW56374.1 PAS domain-containing protein [Kordiimonas sp. SCSIO 12610]